MKRILGIILFSTVFISLHAQTSFSSSAGVSASFLSYQLGFQRPKESYTKKEANLKTLFEVKDLEWPAKYMYIRSFKYDSQLEVWVKNTVSEKYKLLKVYKVCALAGTLGPKRFEGDYQVPEGFYHINEFNPNSSYYLSLGINYPNASDRVLSDSLKPGGDIYIHGGCATVGCIPILNDQIDELYILAAASKSTGLDYIPVHIFPIKFDVQKSYEYLGRFTKDNPAMKAFSAVMEDAYDYFEQYKQMPVVMIKDDGDYEVANALPRVLKFQPKLRPKVTHKPIVRKIDAVANSVAKWPEYSEGGEAYAAYLKKIGKELVKELPENRQKVYAQVEFIIDRDGTPVNFKVLNGVDEYFNSMLIKKMEEMAKWKPALFHDKAVAKKMVQTVAVGFD